MCQAREGDRCDLALISISVQIAKIDKKRPWDAGPSRYWGGRVSRLENEYGCSMALLGRLVHLSFPCPTD